MASSANKDLTTIKVPGKNRRDQRRRNHTVVDPRPGRPLRSSKSLSSSQSSSRASTPIRHKPQKTRSLRNIKSRNKLASIEKLPVELLTRIFLLNPTPFLPLSSPILGAKLSSEHIYTQCLLSTFSPYWEHQVRRFELNTAAWHDLPKEEIEKLPEEPSSKVQSAILCCRWATFTRLRHVESYFLLRKHKPITSPLFRFPQKDCETFYQSFLDDQCDSHFEIYINQIPMILTPASPHFRSYQQAGRQPLLFFRKGTVDIPISVLRGPWTQDEVKYLWHLWRADGQIDRYFSTAGEEAAAGLKLAILSQNIHATHLLHDLGTFIPFTTPLILQFLRNFLQSNPIPSIPPLLITHGDFPLVISSENVLNAFIKFFKNNLQSKYDIEYIPYEKRGYLEKYSVDYVSEVSERKRAAEVEREVLELRKTVAGASEDRKREVEWMVAVLKEIYNL